MKDVFLLHRCDAWHTPDSMELIAVFTEHRYLEAYLRKMKFWREITQEEIDELLSSYQTQGRDTNYFILPQKINPEYIRN